VQRSHHCGAFIHHWLARISHRPGYHSDFGEDVERKSDQAGWAV